MDRRFPLLLLWLLVGVGLPGCREPAPRQVILVTIDTLRADRLGCYGYQGGTSPHIDSLAEESVLFSQTSAQAPWTTASFASLLSGRAPSESWVLYQSLDPKIPYLAEILSGSGMATAAVISNPNLRAGCGFDRGFDRYMQLFGTIQPEPGRPSKIQADLVTDTALALLPDLARKDFFLWVLYMEPHRPFVRHPDHCYRGPWPFPEDIPVGGDLEPLIRQLSLKDPDSDGLIGPPRGPPGSSPSRGAPRRPPRLGDRTDAPPPSEELQRAIDYLYDGEIRQADLEVNRLLTGLRRQGILDDALLILTSDHGESLYDHYNFLGHGPFPFQTMVHVPLIIRWPRARPGRVTGPVALVDLFPTMLEFLDLPVPTDLQGTVLSPEGRRTEPPILVQTMAWRHRALRSGPYKLVQWEEPDAGELSLFQVETDPAERTDLEQKNPEEVHRLMAELTEVFTNLEPASRATPAPTPEPEIRDQLKALGYVD